MLPQIPRTASPGRGGAAWEARRKTPKIVEERKHKNHTKTLTKTYFVFFVSAFRLTIEVSNLNAAVNKITPVKFDLYENVDFGHKKRGAGGQNLTTVLFTSDIVDNYAWPLNGKKIINCR